jgi:hypothetical protein
MACIRDVLKQISHAAKAALERQAPFFASENAAVTLISGLAEGADRMAAQAAVDQGLTLSAVLPFPIDIYEQDFFEQSSRAEYRALIDKAKSILALCGDYMHKPSAYESAGLTILGNSDILVAVWDGKPSEGQGGTTELVECAAKNGLPIIHIDAAGKRAPRLLWGGLTKFPLSDVDLADLPVLPLAKSLPDLVDKLVGPPPAPDTKPSTKLPKIFYLPLQLFLGKREPTTLAGFFKEPPRKWNLRLEFPLFLGVLGVRMLRRTDIQPIPPDISARDFAQLVRSEVVALDTKRPKPVARAAEAYGWADSLANRYAQMYRSAQISNFILVALGAVGAWGALRMPPFAFDWTGAQRLFVYACIAFSALLYINAFTGNFRNWHKRWMEAREVAERLRAGLPIWMLGQRRRKQPGEEATWVDWYVRATYRAMGICTGCLDLQRLSAIKADLSGFVGGQAQYHSTSAALMKRVDQRLVFISTALVVIVALLSYFFGESFGVFGVLLLAVVPAAIYGIRVTGDFEGRAERSERTAGILVEIRDTMQLEPVTLSNLRARAQYVYQIILAESTQWRTVAESRPLVIPG